MSLQILYSLIFVICTLTYMNLSLNVNVNMSQFYTHPFGSNMVVIHLTIMTRASHYWLKATARWPNFGQRNLGRDAYACVHGAGSERSWSCTCRIIQPTAAFIIGRVRVNGLILNRAEIRTANVNVRTLALADPAAGFRGGGATWGGVPT